MRLMIEWVAQGVWDGGGPGLKLLEWFGILGDKLFGHVIGAHGLLFVMIVFESAFEQIVELVVFGEVAWWKMVVVIEDRLFFGELMIEAFGGLGLQEKIFVNELHMIFCVESFVVWDFDRVVVDEFVDDCIAWNEII